MARPRRDDERPDARERMKEAFWALLAERPFFKIAVSDIARVAQVNRNSFYYHFENMDDLARASVRESVPIDLLLSVMPQIVATGAPSDELLLDPEVEGKFARMRLLAGPHSTTGLVAVAKESALDAWLDKSGLSRDDLSAADLVSIGFVMGGVINVIGDEKLLGKAEHPLKVIWGSPVIAAGFKSILEVFDRGRLKIG